MKLIKNKINLKKIFELNLIKSKIYEHSVEKNKLVNIKLNKIISNFKNAIYIIFKYHVKNKNILFVGTPKTIEKKINLKTIHTSIPNSVNIQNFNINKSIIKGIKLKQKLLKKNKYNLTEIKNKPNLVVVFNEKLNQSVIKESYLSKIPVIVFGSNFDKIHNKYGYRVEGNTNLNKNVENIFFIMLNAVLNFSKK